GHTVMGAGERGELCLSGPQVMQGYWNNVAETDHVLKKLPCGRLRLHTGDVAVMEADGYFRIVDRIKDMILCSGFNVYPRMVEEAIYKHPAVAEAAVVGIDDAYRGQTVKAFVQLKAGATLTHTELQNFLRDKLSPIEMPKQIEFCAELPKTLIGKISKKALRQSVC
ncbi:MAG: long-chain fatty acid--CoA ligase, partial [Alphaproteobacteria bacterium]|nr:long-chain fatty acid--CoA ligase [Alphaproteobacteria bacterium]